MKKDENGLNDIVRLILVLTVGYGLLYTRMCLSETVSDTKYFQDGHGHGISDAVVHSTLQSFFADESFIPCFLCFLGLI